jgi:hypothetical protein
MTSVVTRGVLLAPVTVTPTKPLGPSHLKGLLWTDVMFRATRLLTGATYRYSPTTYHACEQTVGFWEYLDRTLGDTDYSGCSEAEIGELYVNYRADPRRAPFAACRPYVEAIEKHGWVHPASVRILQLWTGHYRWLGMHDPGLTLHQPPELDIDAVLEALRTVDMCLDLREHGGPVYLDATRHGLALRQIVAADGRPNYLACALRELVALARGYDEIVLLHDSGLEADYLLLRRVLARLGATVHRVALGRVPIGGRISSARHGDWRGHTVGALRAALGREHSQAAVRLGLRLYFIAVLGRRAGAEFRWEVLRRSVRRAERLLERAESDTGSDTDPAGLAGTLARHRGDHRYVDPYRLAASLLIRHGRGPGPELPAEVFT